MPLNDTDRKNAAREYARKVFVASNATANLTTSDIEAAITSLVDFIEANAVAVNSALPEPFKSAATLEQKRLILALATIKLSGL